MKTDTQRISFLEKLGKDNSIESVSLGTFRSGWLLTIEGGPNTIYYFQRSIRKTVDEAQKAYDQCLRRRAKAQKLVSDTVKGRHYSIDWWDVDSPSSEYKASVSF